MKHFLLITLFALITFFANAQCNNYHVSLQIHDDCSITGDRTQTATVTNGIGPYTYQWFDILTNTYTTGTTNVNTSGLPYAIAIVTDAAGCRDSSFSDIFYTDVTSCSGTSAACTDFNVAIAEFDASSTGDVLLTATPSSGTAPYNYFYYGMASSGAVTGFGSGASFSLPILTDGNTFIKVVDANGCIARDSFYLTDNIACQICTMDTIMLNTGMSNILTALPGGSTDPHWVITALPGPIPVSIAPIVMTAPDISYDKKTEIQSRWINYDDIGPNSNLFDYHTFTRKFNVCTGGNFLINYTALADNDVSIYLDGTLISSTSGFLTGWMLSNAATAVNYPVNLTAGTHQLNAIVNNQGNIQGFWMEGSVRPATTNPGVLIPDTCISQAPIASTDCNVVTDDFTNPSIWNHPVILPFLSCPSYYNTLTISGGLFKFQQSRDNSFNYMHRNVGAIDDNNFQAKIDFKHQTTVPGWGTAHVLLALTDAPIPFFNNPATSTGGSPCVAPPISVTNSILDGIAITYESTGVSGVSAYDFKVYTKDNGILTSVGLPVSVAGNLTSYLTLQRSGTQGKLTVYSDAARTLTIGNSGWFTIPNTINSLTTAEIGTMEHTENDRMLTGFLDNLCINNGLPLSVETITTPLFAIHPNPAKDVVQVTANYCIENVQIFSINGQQMLAFNTNAKQATISTMQLPRGIYFVKIKMQGAYYLNKLIIE